jgi:DNA-binding response OmpR family regulator
LAENCTKKPNINILIVDDEADITTVLKKGLELEGFDVDASAKPLEVLENYVAGRYDLLLLDVRMPGIAGFELYREIRKIDRKVKVCFITAFEIYFDEFRRVFPRIHVSCFIHKPITIAQLAEAVREELTRPIIEDEPAPTQTLPREHHTR